MKYKKEKNYPLALLLLLAFYSARSEAQDDIDEPAGDIAEAQEDSEFEASGEPSFSEESSMGADSGTGTTEQAEPAGDGEGSQAGPVWESYNDNFKSVAQEVTRGLRVEDVVEPPTEYQYAAFGKPDPFVAPILAMKTNDPDVISGLEVPIVSPLQRFDVSQLRLVGVWQLPSGERKALIMAPAGEGSEQQGIIARNGDPIGKRAGKILAIGDTFLTIREFKLKVDGTREYEDIQMPMGERDSSRQPGRLKFTPGADSATLILDSDRSTVVSPNLTVPTERSETNGANTGNADLRSAAPGPSQVISAPIPLAPPQAVPPGAGSAGNKVQPAIPTGSAAETPLVPVSTNVPAPPLAP